MYPSLRIILSNIYAKERRWYGNVDSIRAERGLWVHWESKYVADNHQQI